MLALYRNFDTSPGLNNKDRYSELVCIINAYNNWDCVPDHIQKEIQEGKLFHRWL